MLSICVLLITVCVFLLNKIFILTNLGGILTVTDDGTLLVLHTVRFTVCARDIHDTYSWFIIWTARNLKWNNKFITENQVYKTNNFMNFIFSQSERRLLVLSVSVMILSDQHVINHRYQRLSQRCSLRWGNRGSCLGKKYMQKKNIKTIKFYFHVLNKGTINKFFICWFLSVDL